MIHNNLKHLFSSFRVEQGNDLAYEAKFRVDIFYSGIVFWGPGFKVQTHCKVNLLNFPFDTQTCEIIFINWVYKGNAVNFTIIPNADPVELTNYQPNGEWELIKTEAKVDYYEYQEEQTTVILPQAIFTLNLKRKPMYHIINVMLPCIIISLIAGLQFLLPPSSGEKISLGISVLLSFSVLLLLLSDIMPKTSEVVPLIGKWRYSYDNGFRNVIFLFFYMLQSTTWIYVVKSL